MSCPRRVPRLIRGGLSLILTLLGAAGAGAEAGRWAPVPGKSQVAFEAKFSLGDFAGRGDRLEGEITLDPADLRQSIAGSVKVDVLGLRTGLDGRDRDMRKTLEADRFPSVRFTVESVESSFPSVTDKADVLLTIRGRMQIRDVERPLTLLGRARFRAGELWVRGDATVKFTDFGMAPPRRLFVAVRDELMVTFDLTLAPAR